MKSKKETFHFPAGKYVVGDLSKVFDEKTYKKMKPTFTKLKQKRWV